MNQINDKQLEINYLQEDIAIVKSLIYDRIDEIISQKLSEITFVEALREACNYYNHGGKMVRPTLLFLFSQINGKTSENLETIVDLGAAIELVHISSLIVDDIIDFDMRRRGKPTLWMRYGKDTAMLTSHYLVSLASELSKEFAPDLRTAIQKMVVGQQMDLEIQNSLIDQLDIEDIIEMQSHKSSPLFQLACVWGSRLAGVNTKDLDKMRYYGKYLAIVYQLRDDWLDMNRGDLTETGKDRGHDILNGTKSTAIMLTLENIPTLSTQKWFSSHIGEPMREGEEKVMISIIDQYGRQAYERLSEKYMIKARNIIDEIGNDNPVAQRLLELIQYAAERNQ